MRYLRRFIKKFFNFFGYSIVGAFDQRVKMLDPEFRFYNYSAVCHTQRRQEHLASLGLEIAGCSVLEAGAGVGVHTSFFIDRGCRVTTSDPRKENIGILRMRYPGTRVLQIDLENPPDKFNEVFDIVYCYGVLYHLKTPDTAIEFMARCCRKMLLICTCVSFDSEERINLCPEDKNDPNQSFSGTGCRPTRMWVYNQLKKYFQFVYLPITQPNNEDFPLDWSSPELHKSKLARAVFIASRERINNALLREEAPMKQVRAS